MIFHPTQHGGDFALLATATVSFAQAWSAAPVQVGAGTVVYTATYQPGTPRYTGTPGEHWHVAHTLPDADGTLSIRWAGEPVWITYAPAPLEYATTPHPALAWITPADWDQSGRVDVFDILAYLDDWFRQGRTTAELQIWIGLWMEGTP